MLVNTEDDPFVWVWHLISLRLFAESSILYYMTSHPPAMCTIGPLYILRMNARVVAGLTGKERDR